MSDEQGETGTDAHEGASEAAAAGARSGPDDADGAGGNGTPADSDGSTVGSNNGSDVEEPVNEEPTDDSATDEESTEQEPTDEESTEDGPPVDEIADRVADAEPASVAAEIADLRETVRRLEADLAEAEAEREDLEDRLKRKAAEFQNYKKRQEDRRAEIRDRATEDLVEELLEVRDNLDRALEQDEDADIREGVEATFRQLEEILAGENVEPIEPAPGSEVDPTRHEVLLNVPSDRPDGTVAELHRPGYEMAGKVLRPAQVTVADGDPE